jgi:hypothetical protein
MHRPQHEGRAADPVGQRRAVKIDAPPGIDLSLAIERQMIGIFALRLSALSCPAASWSAPTNQRGRVGFVVS